MKRINLQRRVESERNLNYLLTNDNSDGLFFQSMKTIGPHPDLSSNDIYSLGMTILNVIFPFNKNQMRV